jgi:glycosyltransferase involved in cell wall biosynthesis
MRKKIAYIRIFDSIPIGHSVEQMLRWSFPEYDIETIVLTKLLKRNPHIMLLNVVPLLVLYGSRLLRGRKKRLWNAFFATPYLFKRVKSLVKKQLTADKESYVFSFQLQSLFDTSTGFMPHFVYIDHTHLANLTYPEFDRKDLYAKAWVALEKSIYEQAQIVFTRSMNISKSLVEQYGIGEEKVRCIYVGVNSKDAVEFRPKADYLAKQILFVGIDWERKGGPILLEAFQAVLAKHPDVHLTIVGASPDIDVPNCHVVGRVPVTDIDQYYRNASIFCLPTLLEPFGVAFIEAMTYQLPIIGTNIGAIPDFVVDDSNGYLVAPRDVTTLTNALLKLLDDSERRFVFGQKSYQIVQEKYNWQQVGVAARHAILPVISEGEPIIEVSDGSV